MIINNRFSNKLEAVIFDLDATLLDTEPNWFKSDKRLLADYGIDLTPEMKQKYIGRSIDDMLDDLINVYEINESRDVLFKKKNDYYLEIAKKDTAMFPQMRSLVDELKKLNIPLGVASGTALNVIKEIFNSMNLMNDFVLVMSSGEVDKGKPHPDVYLEAADRLKIKPENIAVFEDSLHGVQSAKAAGMFCLAIPYFEGGNVILKDFEIADVVFDAGMDEVSFSQVFEILKI